MRVAIVGELAVHKGLPLVLEVLRRARRRRLNFELVVIGSVPLPLVPAAVRRDPHFQVTGAYADADLAGLIARVDPDVIWFPARWPETFSYTLSAALATPRAIAAPRIGAFAERLAGDPAALVYPWSDEPGAILDHLVRAAALPRTRRAPLGTAGFYGAAYLHDVARPAQRPGSPPVVTYETRLSSGQFDACAYIRVRLPLRHPAAGIRPVLSLREGTLPRAARAVVVQRTALRDVGFARELVAWCAAQRAPLVYETDDDLFGIPPSHPEYEHYRRESAAARVVAAAADRLTTSTEPLAAALRAVNPRVAVLPNVLDERLWLDGPARPSPAGATGQRALYMGTLTHAADVALLRDAAARLAGAGWALEVVGVTTSDERWFTRLDVPGEIATDYPAFVRWMRAQAGRWAFGLAPLRDDPFNAAKSPIKAYDYAALGLATVASDVAPYRALAAAGFPLAGLVAGRPEAWARAVGELLAAPERGSALGGRARAWLAEHGTLAAVAPQRHAAVDEILRQRLSGGRTVAMAAPK